MRSVCLLFTFVNICVTAGELERERRREATPEVCSEADQAHDYNTYSEYVTSHHHFMVAISCKYFPPSYIL